MDITTMTLIELKALAYDTLSKIETQQQNLRIINKEISLKSKPAEPV